MTNNITRAKTIMVKAMNERLQKTASGKISRNMVEVDKVTVKHRNGDEYIVAISGVIAWHGMRDCSKFDYDVDTDKLLLQDSIFA